jgi:iron(III) transport system permease protein
MQIRWASFARGAVVFVIAALIALPMITVLSSLFLDPANAWNRVTNAVLPLYALNTVMLMILTGLIATVIGVATGWCVAMLDFPGRKLLSSLLILPLATPAYILAYVYVDLLDYFGPAQTLLRTLLGQNSGPALLPSIRNIPGAALILGLALYPYVYLLSRTSFGQQSANQWLAARSLGQSPSMVFRRVSFPMARPAIAGGLALVLMETLADFGVADYFGIPTFSTGIFRSWLAGGDRAGAMRLAAIMLLFVFALVGFEAASRRGQIIKIGKSQNRTGRIALSPSQGWGVALLCGLPVAVGFFIPVTSLVFNMIQLPDARPTADFLNYLWNSLRVGGLVAIIAVFTAGLLAYVNRGRPNPVTRVAIRFSTLGYALPGALLAIGLLIPLGVFDQRLTRASMTYLNWDGGLILSGTIALLVFALLIRFLTVAFNTISSGFSHIPPNMDWAARSLGASPKSVIGRIHLPLLRSSFLVGGLLVFVDTLRELPATLILRPFNFETLATRIYWLASDERIAEASTASILVILCGLLPVFLINRTFDN